MRNWVLTFLMMGILPGCVSERCYVDCAPGYEVDGCDCRPIPYSGKASSPLGSCLANGTCWYGLDCIKGCPPSESSNAEVPAGICSMAERDLCSCDGPDTCTTSGTSCLRPACCGYQGICVKPEERKAICARPEGVRFDCAGAGTKG